LNKYGVAAEVVGRIKGCHHTKTHQDLPGELF